MYNPAASVIASAFAALGGDPLIELLWPVLVAGASTLVASTLVPERLERTTRSSARPGSRATRSD